MTGGPTHDSSTEKAGLRACFFYARRQGGLTTTRSSQSPARDGRSAQAPYSRAALYYTAGMRLIQNKLLVPTNAEKADNSVEELADFIRSHPRLFVLTGAGISLASGIPTYRHGSGLWKTGTPIQHSEFLRSARVRRRYWARSMVGWPAVAKACPNSAHHSLVRLERRGFVELLVTQNVDRLHQRAGQRRAIDLHGRLDQVGCLDCGALLERAVLQRWLEAHNPDLRQAEAAAAPDGDAAVNDSALESFREPSCSRCGGVLKPNVVFYGDSVARPRVNWLQEQLDACSALLVVGSSLMVYSGYRFCRHASERGLPIACINAGRTRADELYATKVAADCGPALERLEELL